MNSSQRSSSPAPMFAQHRRTLAREADRASLSSAGTVKPDEVEDASVGAIEVTVLWGANVLRVWHLSPAESFCVGEEVDGPSACDYFVPSDVLGAARCPLVVGRAPGAVLVIPPRAGGELLLPGEPAVLLRDLVARGSARPSAEVAGGHELDLVRGVGAMLRVDGTELAFRVSAVAAGRRVARASLATLEPRAYLCTGLSFVLHASVAALLAFFVPRMAIADTEALDRDQLLTMQKLLNAAAEREQEERSDDHVREVPAQDHQSGGGRAAAGEAGALGESRADTLPHAYGVRGPRDDPDPHTAREAELESSARFGVIGLLRSMRADDPNAPTATWGREEASGRDARSALGDLFGADIGEAAGSGGLGPSGAGEGGGGSAASIGLRDLGDLGRRLGGGPGRGIGQGPVAPTAAHHVRAPRLREDATRVSGRLPPEIIQRTVRQSFGRFRFCYEQALRGDPSLEGRVVVRFVIDRTGSVQMAADGGSDLPDRQAVQCVVRGFESLSFPPPDGGLVTVVYPIRFTPGE